MIYNKIGIETIVDMLYLVYYYKVDNKIKGIFMNIDDEPELTHIIEHTYSYNLASLYPSMRVVNVIDKVVHSINYKKIIGYLDERNLKY